MVSFLYDMIIEKLQSFFQNVILFRFALELSVLLAQFYHKSRPSSGIKNSIHVKYIERFCLYFHKYTLTSLKLLDVETQI